MIFCIRQGGMEDLLLRPVSVFIIRLIEKVLLARDENWKQKFIRSDILYFPFSIIAINYYLSTVTSYNFINTFQKYTIERGKKKFEMLRDLHHLDGYVSRSVHQAIHEISSSMFLIRTEYKTISSFPRSSTSTHVLYG